MDDQQHALAGLLRTIPIVAARAAPPTPTMTRRRAGCGSLALLLALNPARAAFGIPRAGRSPREVARLAAVGGALGGLAVCAARGRRRTLLLDALDVSAPAFRTAAGILAVLTGAADLFRRPPVARTGARRAGAPRSSRSRSPLVARPALLVMALGAGADHGVARRASARWRSASRC